MNQIPEERSETGKPMVPATPRDVVHIRIGSFILVIAIALGGLSFAVGAGVLSFILLAVAVIAIVDIILAVRRQRGYGGGPEGLE